MAVVAIDFDNTLVNGKDALIGAREAINILRELGHKIIIHSCNEPEWIERVLNDNDIRFDLIWKGRAGVGKPLADLYVDDKGYHFPHNGNWSEELPAILVRLEGKDNRKW